VGHRPSWSSCASTSRAVDARRIAPLEPAGVIYGQLVTTLDARYYLIRFGGCPAR
jgi:hypothetical protein